MWDVGAKKIEIEFKKKLYTLSFFTLHLHKMVSLGRMSYFFEQARTYLLEVMQAVFLSSC